jgi:acyl-CoA dehydrogenase
MNYQLTEEQSMIIDSLSGFLDQEIYPHEAEADRNGMVSEELGNHIKQKAIEMGFYAANLPESVGGGGLDYTTLGLIERELGKASYGLAGHIARPTEILLACEGEQREKYLLPCVTGEKHESFALTEPGAGSDIMSMATRAVHDGDDYIINGSNRNQTRAEKTGHGISGGPG